MSNQTNAQTSPFLKTTIKVIFGLAALIWVLAIVFKDDKPVQATPAASTAIGYGQTGIIHTGLPAGVTEADYDAVMNAATTKDQDGINALVSAKRAVMVDNNTKVKVIGSGFNKRQVRLLNGDNQGAAVWVPVEYIEAE